MLRKRTRSSIVIVTAFSIINFANAPSATADSSGSGGFFSKLFGGLVSGLYKRTPEFKKYVAPYIINMSDFDTFMDQYNYKNNLSEKDSIDLIIKLGVLKHHPEWLDNRAIKLIDKYYPSLRSKKAEISKGRVLLASNCNTTIESDYGQGSYEVAQGMAIPIVIFSYLTMETISYLAINGLSKKDILENLKEDKRILEIKTEENLCQGNCTHDSVPQNSSSANADFCKKVIEDCRAECTETYGYGKERLPGVGKDYPGRIRRCIRECASPQGCDF